MNGSSFGRTHTVSTLRTFRSKLLNDVKVMNDTIDKIHHEDKDRRRASVQMKKDTMNPKNYYYRREDNKTVGVCYKLFVTVTDRGMHNLLNDKRIHLHTVGHFYGKTYNGLIGSVKKFKKGFRPDINVLYHIHYNKKAKAWDGIAGVYYLGKMPKINANLAYMWKFDHTSKDLPVEKSLKKIKAVRNKMISRKELNMPKARTSAQKFVDNATALWNGLNAHPEQPDIYGKNLLDVATSLGTHGFEIVMHNHLYQTDKKPVRLMWSESQQKIAVKNAPHGKIWADIGFAHKDEPKNPRKPKLSEIRSCFYQIFVPVIFPIFRDKSRLQPGQIRFLMRLSGLKMSRASDIISGFTAMLSDLKGLHTQTGSKIQGICAYVPIILSLIDNDKRNAFFHIMQAAMMGRCVSITPRKDYLKQVDKLPKGAVHIDKAKVPDDTFVAVEANLQCRRVTANDLKKIAKTFIYYLS